MLNECVNSAGVLNGEKVAALLSQGGAISKVLPSYEPRNEQIEMLKQLVRAFNHDAVALIEAGTGTGKSIAYLLPSLLYAAVSGERVVISTHTISLQEQILNKDLPLLMSALGISVKTVLVKGMGNYPCMRRIQDMEFDKLFLSEEEKVQLEQIEMIAARGYGSKSDLKVQPSAALWEQVAAEQDSCNGMDCPHFSSCLFMNARRGAQEGKILVVNHHLLFADLAARAENGNYTGQAVLPPYTRLIIDEAHNLEEIATQYFSARISRLGMMKTLAKLSAEQHGGTSSGKLPQLKERAQKQNGGQIGSKLSALLSIELPSRRRDLFIELGTFFSLLEKFFEKDLVKSEENKVRLKERHFSAALWNQELLPQAKRTKNAIQHYVGDLALMGKAIKEEESERFHESVKGILADISALSEQLQEAAESIERLIEQPPTLSEIRWIEAKMSKHGLNIALIQATLDISKILLQALFNPYRTVALVSATLTARGSFAYLKERVGLSQLPERLLIETKVDSPFDYEKQAQLIIPNDLPDPSDAEFLPKASDLIVEAIEASRGNAFILFTSHQMMKNAFDRLNSILQEKGFHPLCQGSENGSSLLKKFIRKDRSVLFGTDSFWEGVDVAGEALRLVIIVKLPFKVPSDPLIEARSEDLLEKGKDPFYHYQLPQAAIKLKQGFGRLIRNRKDRGCILCLDNRLIKKNYGKFFLGTLPKCPLKQLESSAIKQEMIDFYRRTYGMTK